MTKKYILENAVFQEALKKVENITESLIVLDAFCNQNRLAEEVQNIHPILKYICNEAGSLYNYFLNKRAAQKGEKITFYM